ncbi:membrane protein insertase YidC [Luteitalea sp. TBR-22]|uniref:membrane protein insertase YidC n=1 Tax=Luteitalea sp. TBR-22 TaxID=2802971 RepID=UPI001AF540A9|nr:membrane protein insertase YidC [Luteitalea sp. TBR-22]BCS36124.1 membrane protein insertase YidC [Luteitalea sp. TBR-22]
MEKRVLQAVLLSLAVLLLYQSFFAPRRQPTPVAKTTTPAAAPASSTSPSGPASVTGGAQRPPMPLEKDVPAAAKVVVESDQFKAEFSTRGAVLLSWTLKQYPGAHGHALDLIPDTASNARPPFSLTTSDETLTNTLATATYTPSATTLDLRGKGERTLRFEYTDPSGVRATKVFTFERDGQPFLVGFAAQVLRNGQPQNFAIHSGAGIGDIERAHSSGGFMSGNYYQAPEAITYIDKIARTAPAKLAESPVVEGNVRYAGVDDHYFLGAAILGRQTRIDYGTHAVQTTAGPRTLVSYALSFPQPPSEVKFYFGPKDFDQLMRSDQQLVRTINFGWFAWLVVPLLRALKWVNGFVGNYGWSIIVLTILINIAIFPLRHKSVVSMRKMQDIQPRVKAIQDRYAHLKATDPARQKMNTELMELYKTAGVNPASGCVPMLLTMPVLFAFYALLSVAIELRGAPFMLWITDLSQHDPLYITPVIMGATMLWQQWITPAAGMDPAQKNVMMIMPLMFTFFFIWAPSGLVIYWLFSNLLTIGQQYLTNRIVGAPAKPAKA